MQEAKLKTAVLGLGEAGKFLLEAASASDRYILEAVADKDSVAAHESAAAYDCAAFDDYRQLIIQAQLDCLLVAAPIHQCDEHIRAAMKKKFHVLKMAPPARDFKQTAELIHFAVDEGVKFATGNPWRFDPAYVDLNRCLTEKLSDQPLLINAVCQFPNQSRLGWETDPNLAGGGVLLHNCWHIIDFVVWTFGLPQLVYCLSTNIAADRQQRLYLTEDIAVLTMKFHDTLLANLVCSRTAGTSSPTESLRIHRKEEVVAIENDILMMPKVSEQVNKTSGAGRQQLFSDMLNCFGLSILRPDNNTFAGTSESDMRTMSVIEAAYLSSRTGFPEDPAKVPLTV
jgi:predicted dehydrogenase